MEQLAQGLSFIFFYQILVSLSLVISAPNLCRPNESLTLWNFKQSINIDANASLMCDSSYPKMQSWNISNDCCFWDGVTCDRFSGGVIGLDLSCSQLKGAFNSSSTLFQLSRLQSLNLAYNDFASSLIPRNFSRLQSLTHLNLSTSGFSGQIPSDFLRLYNLISLDLSNFDITVEPYIFELLLQNSTRLKEVSLSGAYIGLTIPLNLSASLTVLNLGGTHLFGETPTEIFQLPNLQILQLFQNENLTGNLLKVEWNTSSALSYLDLSRSNFSGKIPQVIGNLKSLYYLDLSFCQFSESIPESLGNLTQLTYLSLFTNNLTGQVPSSLGHLEQLITLDLSHNSLGGQLPNFFNSFDNLIYLSLSNNHFTGSFPSSVINLTRLDTLYLSNNLLTGPLPANISGFPKLASLNLGYNSFSSTIPSWILSLPALQLLNLQSNQLTGQLYNFRCQSLQQIFLDNNKLQGPIPQSISELVNLTSIELSYNNFSGDVEVSIFSNLKHLSYLSLSFNNLSLRNNQGNSTMPPSIEVLYLASCGVKDLDFLVGASNLDMLDLSSNMLHHTVTTDQKLYTWSQNLHSLNLSFNFLTEVNQLPSQKLNFLDLSSNLLSGPLFVPPVRTEYFFALNNGFSGEIPSSICNLSRLQLLDLSNNSLSGVIPQCISYMSMYLLVLDLHDNNFEGIIPSNFSVGTKLRNLNLRNNSFEGAIPVSLSTLNLSENHLVGRIPTGTQLDTFQTTSYSGNDGLCGPPLSKACGATVTPAATGSDLEGEDEHEGFISGFTWQAVLIGYGTGVVIGLSMGFLSFTTAKPKWFNKIVEEEGKKWTRKKWPREVRWLSKSGR